MASISLKVSDMEKNFCKAWHNLKELHCQS